MAKRPDLNSLGNKELDDAEKQFHMFEKNVKSLTLDRMNEASKEEVEPIVKLSQKDIARSPDIYLKPARRIACAEKFNEDYRQQYEFDKQYVHFTAENREVKGDKIEFWTKPYAGIPAEFWEVPHGKPVWAPRYVAERIKGCTYHRLKMEQKIIGINELGGQEYGQMVADQTIQRLDALPVSGRKSVFMGETNFG